MALVMAAAGKQATVYDALVCLQRYHKLAAGPAHPDLERQLSQCLIASAHDEAFAQVVRRGDRLVARHRP